MRLSKYVTKSSQKYTFISQNKHYITGMTNERKIKKENKITKKNNNTTNTDDLGRSHILVSDIDGTLLRNGEPTPGLGIIRQLVETHANEVALVYATGRSIESTLDLISRNVLPQPAAIAPFIGTEIWFFPFTAPSGAYHQHLQEGWRREELRFWATVGFGLEEQEKEFQSENKASFYLKRAGKLYDIKQFLSQKNIEARVIYSCGKYLDLLPQRAGKANAVRFLAKRWGIPSSRTLTCGDSGNDIDMLMAKDTCNVAVGNLEKELKEHMGSGRFYTSELPYAAGVLEGATAFDFWPRRPVEKEISANP